MTMTITQTLRLNVNGKAIESRVEPRTLLVHHLRDDLHLTGTHIGCDTSQCGACTVEIDGVPVKSCTVLAVQAEDLEVTTVEATGDPRRLDVLQQAFHETHALQCGFCTPGMLFAARQLLRRHPDPTEHQVRDALHGNLCRCTGYQHIVDAVLLAAERMQQSANDAREAA
jgi:carbon-monoxide dehydrogenase small subunit